MTVSDVNQVGAEQVRSKSAEAALNDAESVAIFQMVVDGAKQYDFAALEAL